MAKSMYHIAFVERGYEEQWRGYWVSKNHDDAVLAAHRAGKLGQVEIIEAGNLTEAINKVRKKHPGCTIMSEGSKRLCAAG
jgi:hypothetical protein